MNLLGDFARSLAMLSEPRFWGVLFRAVLFTFVLLVASAIAVIFGLGALLPQSVSLPWIGDSGLLSTIAMWTGGLATILLSGFLMLPVAALFVGVFLDDIAGAVEARDYPRLPPVEPLPLSQTLADSLRFTLLVIAVNLAALVVYLLTAIAGPILFWLVNGYLLGREYFHLVAARRLGNEGAKRLRQKYFAQSWVAGCAMAVPMSIPLVNLVIPLLGVATFTHFFHRVTRP